MTTTRLTRNLDDAMLGGVLAGIADQYNWDPTLLRIVAVLVALATAVVPAVLIYLAAWVLIPRRDATDATPGAIDSSTAGPASSRPSQPVSDEISDALRDAADRLAEAAGVAADAARQAANEIGDIARRPRATTTEEPPAAESQPAEAAPDEPPAEEAAVESEAEANDETSSNNPPA